MVAKELSRRWAVALVGVPLVVVVLYVGSWALAVVIGLIAALGADECYRLARHKNVRPVAWVGVPTAGLFAVLAVWSATPGDFAAASLLLLGVAALIVLVWITFRRGPGGEPLASGAVTLFGAVYPGLALALVPLLHALPRQSGWSAQPLEAWAAVAMVALPLTATWVGDAAAFFAGSAWGRRRLAPAISPKKSWEGAVAGVAGAAAGAAVWYLVVAHLLPGAPLTVLSSAGLGALIGIGAIVGDLAESVLKRDAGVKDSGTLLPGHGGVLDRVDALVVTLPLSYGLLVLLDAAR
jgi:phosphatidate cytidylyltransferase